MGNGYWQVHVTSCVSINNIGCTAVIAFFGIINVSEVAVKRLHVYTEWTEGHKEFAITACVSEVLFVNIFCGSVIAAGTSMGGRHWRDWSLPIFIFRSCSGRLASLIVIWVTVLFFRGFFQLVVDGFDPFLQFFEAFFKIENVSLIFISMFQVSL